MRCVGQRNIFSGFAGYGLKGTHTKTSVFARKIDEFGLNPLKIDEKPSAGLESHTNIESSAGGFRF